MGGKADQFGSDAGALLAEVLTDGHKNVLEGKLGGVGLDKSPAFGVVPEARPVGLVLREPRPLCVVVKRFVIGAHRLSQSMVYIGFHAGHEPILAGAPIPRKNALSSKVANRARVDPEDRSHVPLGQ